jgi:hypothetical protein
MGHAFALALSETDTPIAKQLAWHLQYNHYPPVPLSMIQPCLEAIEHYWDDSTDAKIELPEGTFWKGLTYAPAWAILEAHHLSPWTADYDYDSEEEY